MILTPPQAGAFMIVMRSISDALSVKVRYLPVLRKRCVWIYCVFVNINGWNSRLSYRDYINGSENRVIRPSVKFTRRFSIRAL